MFLVKSAMFVALLVGLLIFSSQAAFSSPTCDPTSYYDNLQGTLTTTTAYTLIGASGASSYSYPNLIFNAKASSSAAAWGSWTTGTSTITQVPIQYGFSATFSFVATTSALGFAFVIQQSGTTAVGGIADSLGYYGIPNSLAVVFNTGKNSVSIKSSGSAANTGELLAAQTPTGITLNSGATYYVKISYYGAGKNSNNGVAPYTLNVYVSSSSISSSTPLASLPAPVAQVTLPSELYLYLGGSTNTAIMGFTTGFSVASATTTITISNFVPVITAASPTNSVLTFSSSTTVVAGSPVPITLGLFDACQNPFTPSAGATEFAGTLSGATFTSTTTGGINANVIINFIPTSSGTFFPGAFFTSYGSGKTGALITSTNSITVTAGAPSATKSVLSVSGTGVTTNGNTLTTTAGTSVAITIASKDQYGNAAITAPTSFTLTTSGPASTAPNLLSPSASSSISYTWIPTKSSSQAYTIAATLNSVNIQSAPYYATVNPGAISPASCTASSVLGAVVNAATPVTISLYDANNNLALITSNSAATFSLSPCTGSGCNGSCTGAVGATSFSCSMTPSTSGTVSMTLNVNSVTIGAGAAAIPITVSAGAFSCSNTKIKSVCLATDTTCASSAASVTNIIAGNTYTININPRDANNNIIYVANGANNDFYVKITGTTASLANPTLASSASISAGYYSYSFTPKDNIGTSAIISINCGAVSSGISTTIPTLPAAASYAASTITFSTGASPQSYVAGAALYLTVQTIDAYGNLAKDASDSFSGIFTCGSVAYPSTSITSTSVGLYKIDFGTTIRTATSVLAPAPTTCSLFLSLNSVSLTSAASTSLTITPAAYSAANFAASGAIYGGQATTPLNITLQAKDIYGNIITGPDPVNNNSLFAAKVAGQSYFSSVSYSSTTGIYSVTYQITNSGQYSLDITVGGVSVKNSPFSIVIGSGTATGNSKVISAPTTLVCGADPATQVILIQAKDVGNNVINGQGSTGVNDYFTFTQTGFTAASISGAMTGGKITSVYSFTNNAHQITLYATIAGTYTGAITVDGSATTITGSPLSFTVNPSATVASQCTLSTALPSTVTAGSQVSTIITLRDLYGNPRGSAGSAETVTLTVGGNAAQSISSTAAVYTYAVNFPLNSAVTTLVLIQTAGTSIKTTSIGVLPATCSAGTSTTTVGNIAPVSGSNSTFTVTTLDANNNPTASCTLTSSDTVISTASFVYSGSNGIWIGTFSTTTAGLHSVSILAGGVVIGSASNINVAPAAPSATTTTATIPTSVIAGNAYTISIQLKDASGNNVPASNAPGASQKVVITAAGTTAGNLSPVSFAQSAYSAGSNWSFTATLTKSDTYKLSATLNGALLTNVNGNTFAVTGSVASASQSLLTCSCLSPANPACLQGNSADSNGKFCVSFFDVYGNIPYDAISSGYNFAATTSVGTVYTPTQIGSSSIWQVAYTNSLAGPFTIEVKIAGNQVLGSPAQALVTPGITKGSSSSYVISPSWSTAGVLGTVTIQSKDQFGNVVSQPSNLESYSIAIAITSPSPGSSARVPFTQVSSSMVSNGVGIYSYNNILTVAGAYTITITHSPSNSGPAPTPITVSSSSPNAAATALAAAPTSVIAGLISKFNVQVMDTYSNYVSSPISKLIVTAQASITQYNINDQFQARNSYQGNGVYTVMFSPSWAGNYSVTISAAVLSTDTLSGITGSPFTVPVAPYTCAAANSATPYFCPQTQNCVANWNLCSGAAVPCMMPTPYKCWDGSCASSLSACPCSDKGATASPFPFTIRCPDGRCASSNSTCLVQEMAPSNMQYCPDLSLASISTNCTYRSPICPPASVTCPDWVTCAASITACPALPDKTKVCGSRTPVLCPDQLTCVASMTDCATQPICTSTNFPVLCPDGSCASSNANCQEFYTCTGDKSIRCADATCVSEASDCPTHVTCAVGNVLCNDGTCALNAMMCSNSPNNCDPTTIKCPDGSCASSPLLCSNVNTCSQNSTISQMKCFDNSCVEDINDCPVIEFPNPSLVKCFDGSFSTSISMCPTRVNCPLHIPIKCSDGTCVASSAACSVPITCPAARPYACPSGGCAVSVFQCPQITTCPIGRPVMCWDGSCATSIGFCSPQLDLIVKPNNQVKCPGFAIFADSLSLCPSMVSCAPGQVKCWDQSCATFNLATRDIIFGGSNVTICTTNQYNALNQNYCANSPNLAACQADLRNIVLSQCLAQYQNYPCPVYNPVKDCVGNTPFKCADGSCRAAARECPTEVLCPRNRPIKCADKSCVESIELCSTLPFCNPALYQTCPDGSCQSLSNQCGTAVTCPSIAPYMCYGQTCVASPADCPPPVICPNNQVFCPNDNICVTNRAQCHGLPACANSEQYLCPQFGTNPTCESGGNNSSMPLCASLTPTTVTLPIQKCPNNYPRCPDGSCNLNINNCVVHVCPTHLPFQCPTGICAQNAGQCQLTSATDNIQASVCAAGSTRCMATGNCVTPPDVCPPALFCPFPYVLCGDGQCVSSSVKCIVATPPTTACATGTPFQCADGTCAVSSLACPIIQFCTSAQSRCADGTCRALGTCGSVTSNTCPTGFIRCTDGYDSGRCVQGTDKTVCRVSTLCPSGNTRCLDGSCMPNCPTSYSPGNGCTNSTLPYKCWNGQCTATDDDCLATSNCPKSTPVRCNSGVCAATQSLCAATTCAFTLCPDGSCPASASSCLSSNGCPSTSPVRCADGSCASAGMCNAVVVCPSDVPFQCADFTCVGSYTLCKTVLPCPTGQIRCSDMSCTAGSCPLMCPPQNPIQCPNGACVTHIADCGVSIFGTGFLPCTNQAPKRCGDGICRPLSIPCPTSATTTSVVSQGCPLNSVTCPDGSCSAFTTDATDLSSCTTTAVVFCPIGTYHCADNTCSTSPSNCPIDRRGYPNTQFSLSIGCANDQTYPIASTQGLNMMSVFIPSGAGGSCTTKTITLSTVAPSTLQASNFPITDTGTQSLYNGLKAFPLNVVLRSIIFNIKTDALGTSLTLPLTFNIRSIPYFAPTAGNTTQLSQVTSQQYCLGMLSTDSTTWSCLDRNSYAITQNNDGTLSVSSASTGTYAILYTAVAFTTVIPPVQLTFLQQYLQQVIIASVCAGVLLILSMYVGYRLRRYQKKWRAAKKFIKAEQMAGIGTELVPAGGSQFGKDDQIQYAANPLLKVNADMLTAQIQSESAALYKKQLEEAHQRELDELKKMEKEVEDELKRLKMEEQEEERRKGGIKKGDAKKKKQEFGGQANVLH